MIVSNCASSMLSIQENMLFFTKWPHSFELESVLHP
jgi:hypothetical protein